MELRSQKRPRQDSKDVPSSKSSKQRSKSENFVLRIAKITAVAELLLGLAVVILVVSLFIRAGLREHTLTYFGCCFACGVASLCQACIVPFDLLSKQSAKQSQRDSARKRRWYCSNFYLFKLLLVLTSGYSTDFWRRYSEEEQTVFAGHVYAITACIVLTAIPYPVFAWFWIA